MQKQWCLEAAQAELEYIVSIIPKCWLPESIDTFLTGWIVPGKYKNSQYVIDTRISVTVALDEILMDSWDLRLKGKKISFDDAKYALTLKMPILSTEAVVAILLYAKMNPSVLEALDYSAIE